jgi:hypothetical protein
VTQHTITLYPLLNSSDWVETLDTLLFQKKKIIPGEIRIVSDQKVKDEFAMLTITP